MQDEMQYEFKPTRFERSRKKGNVLECRISSCSQQLFSGSILSIEFMALDGTVIIMPGYEKSNFLMLPGKINVNRKEGVRSFYHGAGCLEIIDEIVHVIALPIFAGNSYKSIEKETKNIEQNLLNIWKNL